MIDSYSSPQNTLMFTLIEFCLQNLPNAEVMTSWTFLAYREHILQIILLHYVQNPVWNIQPRKNLPQ